MSVTAGAAPEGAAPEPSRPDAPGALSIVLGVGGGIAAYKVAHLLRLFTEAGHAVTVVPTRAALEFVGRTTWEALSGRPAHTDVWTDADQVPHVTLGRHADLVVVAPATADLLAKAAAGLAEDLLGATLLTATCPVLFAPAMHTEMWQHPATVANVATLRARGAHVLEPDSGRLTGADTGPGRLPEPERIAEAALALLRPQPADLAGLRVLISAGGTREPLDPVRFLGNASSGRQGIALAEAARDRGASVTLALAAVDVPVPGGASVHRAGSALQLREVVHSLAADADVVVMAAAVADFRPAEVASSKIKKSGDPEEGLTLRLVRNPDILAELAAARRPGQTVVGFAAETGDAHADVLEHARRKLSAKDVDLLVVNDVSEGRVFGKDETTVSLLHRDGSVVAVPEGSKRQAADAVWDAVRALRERRSGA
ncbi:MAG: bifunctional phosphopantothenoylcysteine decarboxylase/phosphopantothenate--cysteine ligase CoaBC [Kineosporiaceae bacterium]